MDNKFIRFLIVGWVNTLFGYFMFALFIFSKFHYSIAALMATMLGVLFNFKTTGKLVFGNSDNKLILKFFGVYTVVYFMNTLALKVFKMYEVDLYLGGALVLLPMAVLSFLLNKKFVFKG